MIIIRLWHQDLIPYLPNNQLLGQHRECCAMRGKGWGRKHATVDYVFEHKPERLIAYHFLIMNEMEKRNYFVDPKWKYPYYRGIELGFCFGCVDFYDVIALRRNSDMFKIPIYPEHNEKYLNECLDNLRKKRHRFEFSAKKT